MTETTEKKTEALHTRTFASLRRGEGIEERQPLLGTWLRERDALMVFAQAGAGKSMWGFSLALAVAGGGAYLGWESPEAGKGEVDPMRWAPNGSR